MFETSAHFGRPEEFYMLNYEGMFLQRGYRASRMSAVPRGRISYTSILAMGLKVGWLGKRCRCSYPLPTFACQPSNRAGVTLLITSSREGCKRDYLPALSAGYSHPESRCQCIPAYGRQERSTCGHKLTRLVDLRDLKEQQLLSDS